MDKFASISQSHQEIFAKAFTTKLPSLLVGTIALTLLITSSVYAFSQTQKALKPIKLAESLKKPPQQKAATISNELVYSDNKYRFSIKIPKGFETFKRAGNDEEYQIGIRKIGSPDVPITINAQINKDNLTLDDWITNEYGPLYPREQTKINTMPAVLVRNPLRNYISYYVVNGRNIHEFSSSTVSDGYLKVFNSILPTLSFSN